MIEKNPKLPINITWTKIGKDKELYRIYVDIQITENRKLYPPFGLKAVFKAIRLNSSSRNKEIVILIDNHIPYGFHEHDKLPRIHDSRKILTEQNWQEAWGIFQKKIKEL
ncbi:hypothetical protein [Halobacteriovorax marinus]|uniref:hypothetical protein n=1 Tax=Halobacteriovorax marinus TaxID=97084 RepID=UPI003A8D4EBD